MFHNIGRIAVDFSILGNTVVHMRRKAFCLGKYFGGCCGYERSLPCIDFRENYNARRMSAGWGMGEEEMESQEELKNNNNK